jgi:hypothetical protein
MTRAAPRMAKVIDDDEQKRRNGEYPPQEHYPVEQVEQASDVFGSALSKATVPDR